MEWNFFNFRHRWRRKKEVESAKIATLQLECAAHTYIKRAHHRIDALIIGFFDCLFISCREWQKSYKKYYSNWAFCVHTVARHFERKENRKRELKENFFKKRRSRCTKEEMKKSFKLKSLEVKWHKRFLFLGNAF